MPPSPAEVLRASTLLTRFRARELSRQPVAMRQLDNGSKIPEYFNPFLSTAKAANANKHSGSKYSLRRQKELVKAAQVLIQSGHPDVNLIKILPPGPKTMTRVSGGGVNKALAALGRGNSTISVAGVTKLPVPADKARTELSLETPEVIWRGTPRARKPIGMYEGRKVAFKRHIWEREHRERQSSIKKQVRGMEERISTWRNVSSTSHMENVITNLLSAAVGQNSRNKASVLDQSSFIYGV
jgi:Mitochondrial ribosomal protein mL59